MMFVLMSYARLLILHDHLLLWLCCVVALFIPFPAFYLCLEMAIQDSVFPLKCLIMSVFYFTQKALQYWKILPIYVPFRLQKSSNMAYISIESALWVAVTYHKWPGPMFPFVL